MREELDPRFPAPPELDTLLRELEEERARRKREVVVGQDVFVDDWYVFNTVELERCSLL